LLTALSLHEIKCTLHLLNTQCTFLILLKELLQMILLALSAIFLQLLEVTLCVLELLLQLRGIALEVICVRPNGFEIVDDFADDGLLRLYYMLLSGQMVIPLE
jgi:hypothetical protein